ncbi:MAG: hypothetical protein CYG60_19105 [Actinobacteria bacterium]|nr:MAG: hypothetical protein CYG60_19105 [Actinomycetota bacterium]
MTRGTKHVQDSDEKPVDTLAGGDMNALGVLWDRHARPAYSLAARVLRDPGWAEEVVQDVFVRLWSNPRLYDPQRGELRRWLLTVTHHAAVDGLRSRRGTARARDLGPEAWIPLPTMGTIRRSGRGRACGPSTSRPRSRNCPPPSGRLWRWSTFTVRPSRRSQSTPDSPWGPSSHACGLA